MEESTIAQELLKQYQREYNVISEINKLTHELERSMSTNDEVSTQLVLNMREEELEKAEQCRVGIALLEDAMTMPERQRLRRMLKEEPGCEPRNFEESKLLEINQHIHALLDKTIIVDKRISQKLSGEDSYYNKVK